jgi:hypothetical protein
METVGERNEKEAVGVAMQQSETRRGPHGCGDGALAEDRSEPLALVQT